MAVDDSYTKSLLHFDGLNTSTTFTDESGKTWTGRNQAQLDTGLKKFGSAALLLDGTGDSIDTPDSDDWYFGSNPFTIDFWFSPGDPLNAYDCWIGQWSSTPDSANLWKFDLGSGATHPRFTMTTASTVTAEYVATDAQTFSTNSWYHMALVRNGTSVYIFKDGVSLSLTVNTAISINEVPNLTGVLNVGIDAVNGGRDIYGWIDELRVSKGVARWTSNFTPPIIPYSGPEAGLSSYRNLLGVGV